MSFRDQVVDFLTFSRVEQRGIVVLLTILTGLILANILMPEGIPEAETGYESFRKDIIVFESELKKAEEKERAESGKGKNFRYYSAWSGSDTARTPKPKPAVTFTIELNGTDTLELQRLKGIGPAFARRIINYRDRLGGFIAKSQVMEVFGMDSSRYLNISANIAVNPSLVRKIDINNIGFKDLLRHPYFPYEITREIILVRKKMKKFTSAEDLRSVSGITDSTFNKIKGYLVIL